jgi:predicted trehalose synthase
VHSLDYAAASALYEHDAIRPESRGALQLRSEDWRRRAEQVFLAGYAPRSAIVPRFRATRLRSAN